MVSLSSTLLLKSIPEFSTNSNNVFCFVGALQENKIKQDAIVNKVIFILFFFTCNVSFNFLFNSIDRA